MNPIKYVFIFISLVIHDGAANSGPFKAILLSVEKCQVPNAHLMTVNFEIYNTTTKVNLLRGNITINTEYKLEGVRMKTFIWSNNQWKVVKAVNTAACNGFFMPLAALTIGIKYNRKNCVLSKGFYSFTDLDPDKAVHVWMKNQEYGKYWWHMETLTNNGTPVCLNTYSIVEPPD